MSQATKVQFWGAAQTVTGSMHLVHFEGRKVLLDCGLYQGKRSDAFDRNRKLPFDASEIDAVILSHAHIDHSGNLPSLVRSGFKGKIYCTSASRDLAVFMLLDSAKIQENDVRYVNKKRRKQGLPPFKPLYRQPDAVETIKRFRTIDYDDLFDVVPGMTCRFHFVGHMLGAAVVEVNLQPTKGKPIRLVFSGDIGRPNMPILKDPTTVEGAHYVIMEATYGSRVHPPPEDSDKMLMNAVKEVHDTGGRLIIPAFSVGRTQEIVYRLNNLVEAGKLPSIDVFVDSPLAVNATDVFREHVECFDQQMLDQILTEEDEDPLKFDRLYYVRSVAHSKAINKLKQPCVIISASGMCESGRVLHHLKNNIEKPNTIVLFAGYQAPHTLGRTLLEGKIDPVKIYGEPYHVRAKMLRLESSSGHADRNELLDWAQQTVDRGDVRKIALVHCEIDSAESFQELLSENKIGPVIIPERGDEMFMSVG